MFYNEIFDPLGVNFCVWREIRTKFYLLICGHPLPPALFPEGALFSLMDTFSVSEKSGDCSNSGLSLSFILLIQVSVSVSASCHFYCYGSVLLLEITSGHASSAALLLRIALALEGLFCVLMNFEIFFYFCVKWNRGFDWICIESVNCCWQDGHFPVLVFS